MNEKQKPCIVACSVLKDEIDKLLKEDKLFADVQYVSKYFHVDYAEIEKHLRPVIEKALKSHPKNVILVYGDLCLGMDNEMKKLAEEYGIVKIDALNCVDCQLGGKGKYLETDPEHNRLFLSPGMTDFFIHAQDMMRKEGIDEATIKQFFSGMKGLVLLDTLDNTDELIAQAKRLETGLEILEVKKVGSEKVQQVIQEAITKNDNK